jgi:AcrR family transcriptional regulator
MSESARPQRRYDAAHRQAKAQLTRTRIVEAAQRVFLDRGYVGATIPLIAAEAGVAVETVYRSASGKSGLLAAAVQAALAGGVDRSATPVEQRKGIRRVTEAPDAAQAIRAYAATQPGIWSRVGPLLRVLESAAPGDESLVELREQLAAQRLTGMRRFAQHLADRGPLVVPVERAADLLWAVCAQANYDALVVARGWSPAEYQEWLSKTLIDGILRQA